MKVTIKRPVDVEVKTIKLELPVRYGDEDMPYDFPLRKGDMWSAFVDVESGKIRDWPDGKAGEFHMKVVDCGSYYIYDENDQLVASIEGDYVPNKVVPGEWGDYVNLKIAADGVISNWPRRPDFSAFFGEEED